MYKIIKNFWKDFVFEQNLTRPKWDFWSYFNRPYKIVVFWEDRTTGNMDPWEKSIPQILTVLS